mgnify:CR=1 FL=1
MSLKSNEVDTAIQGVTKRGFAHIDKAGLFEIRERVVNFRFAILSIFFANFFKPNAVGFYIVIQGTTKYREDSYCLIS